MRHFRSVVVLGFLCCHLFAPLAGLAAPTQRRPVLAASLDHRPSMSDLFRRFLDFLSSVSEKTGCAIDPERGATLLESPASRISARRIGWGAP